MAGARAESDGALAARRAVSDARWRFDDAAAGAHESTMRWLLLLWLIGGGRAIAAIRILEVPSPAQLRASTDVMMAGFWRCEGLDAAQRAAVAGAQLRDYERKFGGGSPHLLRGAVLAAVADGDGGGDAFLGTASLELGLFDGRRMKIVDRASAERKVENALAELRPRDRRPLAAMPPEDICGALFEDSVRVAPLVANVAVVPSARRAGVGAALVRSCADLAASWGFDELLLEVETANAPARALYEAAGFEELWSAPRTTLVVDAGAGPKRGLSQRPGVQHTAMRRPAR